MEVELKHHYGWERYNVEAGSLDDAAYAAVRQSHDFLTDDNHTHDASERKVQWGGSNIKYRSVRIYRGKDAPEYTGPQSMATDYWFAVEYRPTPPEAGRDE